MPGRLILVERGEDARLAKGYASQGAVVASLSPEASVELERLGVVFKLLEEFTPAAEFNAEALERYRWLDSFVDDLDYRLADAMPSLARLGAKPATFHYYAFKIFFDCLAAKAHLLANALRVLRPDEVLCRPSKPGRFGRELYFEHESVYSQLAPLAAALIGARAVPLGPAASFDPDGWRRALRALNWRSFVKTAWTRLKTMRGRRAPGLPRDGKPLALYLYNDHDLPDLLEGLSHRGFEIAAAPFDDEQVELLAKEDAEAAGVAQAVRMLAKPLWKSLENDPGWRRQFIFHGIDVFPTGRSRLERFVTETAAEVALVATAWGNHFNKRRPACVLSCTSLSAGIIGQSIMSAARRAYVPVILYQEGAGFGVPYCPIYDHTDMRACDMFLAYGQGTSLHLKAAGVTPSGSVREVGSARLDRLVQTLSRRKTSGGPYLYVPTHLHSNIQHHPFNGGTAAYYFEAQKRLIKALATFPDTRFIIKLPPMLADKSLQRWMAHEAARRPNCRVIDNIPFHRFLSEAAGFILDFPSTVLLEALMTDKPIFILPDPWLTKLEPEAESALSRRVVFCQDVTWFRTAFARHLKGERLADSGDRQARRWYATHLDDGRSLERACAAVTQACEKDPYK